MKIPTKAKARQRAVEAVHADELLTLREAMRRLRWSWRAVWAAEEAGLIVRRFRNRDYVLGSDILAFFAGLPAAERNGGSKA